VAVLVVQLTLGQMGLAAVVLEVTAHQQEHQEEELVLNRPCHLLLQQITQ
jgi:hypothetical protein